MLRSILRLALLGALGVVLATHVRPILRPDPLATGSLSSESARLRPGVTLPPAERRRAEPAPVEADTPATLTTPTVERLARLAIRQRLRSERDQIYLDSMVATTDSVIRRWPEPSRTRLRVAVVPPAVPGFQPYMADYVHEALSLWEGLGLGIRFLLVSDSSNADITVRWIDRFQIDRAGQCDLTWDRRGRIRHAAIILALRDTSGYPLPDAGLKAVAVHEVGHSLGLPHSADPNDVMFPAAPVTIPSNRDQRSVALLYQLPAGPIRDIAPEQ